MRIHRRQKAHRDASLEVPRTKDKGRTVTAEFSSFVLRPSSLYSTQSSRTSANVLPPVRGAKSCGDNQPFSFQIIAPTKQIAASGTQYFRHVVMTWSMRNRGSVHRTHIITVTPNVAFRIKFNTPAT